MNGEELKGKLALMAGLPDCVRKVLESREQVLHMSRVFRYASNFLYLGRGFNFPVALEGALKLKEISYIPVSYTHLTLPTMLLV